MKRVCCLYRVSDRGQVEKNDIPMQKIACHTFAEYHGWNIIKEFSEKGVSGYKRHMDDRDAIVQIKESAQMGKFDILLVFTFDRIGRRDDETPFVVEWLTRQGIAVWSVCEGEQCFDNHVDKLTNYIRYWQAAGESERISERTRTRIRQLTKEGHFTGGVCPYGYQLVRQGRVNKKGQPLYDLVICPDEAKVVRLIFEKTALEGYGAYRLAALLNDHKMLPKSGHTWNPVSLYGILKNPLYTGVLHKGGEQSYQEHLKIIDEGLFQEIQELRMARNKAIEPVISPSKGNSLLSGFLYCGTCGSRMAANHVVKHHRRVDGSVHTSRTQRYYCPRRKEGRLCECNGQHTYVAEKVDKIVLQELESLLSPILTQPASKLAEYKMAELRKKYQEQLAAKELFHSTEKTELELLQRELLNCFKGISILPKQDIHDMIAQREIHIISCQREISTLKVRLCELERTSAEIQFQIEKYQRLWAEYGQSSLNRKKMILSHFIINVSIQKNYLPTIAYNRTFLNIVKN